MKFNWGAGIVLAFIIFMGFILFFIIKISTDSKYDHDLVTEDYYKKELGFQKDIDKINNSKTLQRNIRWKKTNEGLIILFPKTFNPKSIIGKVVLYRPSDKRLDFEMPIQLSGSDFLIPNERLVRGRWDIRVNWTYEGEEYLYREKIMY